MLLARVRSGIGTGTLTLCLTDSFSLFFYFVVRKRERGISEKNVVIHVATRDSCFFW